MAIDDRRASDVLVRAVSRRATRRPMPRFSPSSCASTAAGPEFISVTYGANGSSRGVSLDVLRHLLDNTSVTADGAPHLRRLVVRRGDAR